MIFTHDTSTFLDIREVTGRGRDTKISGNLVFKVGDYTLDFAFKQLLSDGSHQEPEVLMSTLVRTMTPGVGSMPTTSTYSLEPVEALVVAYATWKCGGVRTGMPDFEAAIAHGRTLVQVGSDGRTRQIILIDELHAGRAWFARPVTRVRVVRGDITCQVGIEAIVNAANPSIRGGGGVDGAIHRGAGPELLGACKALPQIPREDILPGTWALLNTMMGWYHVPKHPLVCCNVGDARVTDAFDLPARKVIHAVGPLYAAMTPEEARQSLLSAYVTSLLLAKREGCRTVALPAISCGVYGYPIPDAAQVATEAVLAVLSGDEGWFDEVRFVMLDDATYEAFSSSMAQMYPEAA